MLCCAGWACACPALFGRRYHHVRPLQCRVKTAHREQVVVAVQSEKFWFHLRVCFCLHLHFRIPFHDSNCVRHIYLFLSRRAPVPGKLLPISTSPLSFLSEVGSEHPTSTWLCVARHGESATHSYPPTFLLPSLSHSDIFSGCPCSLQRLS